MSVKGGQRQERKRGLNPNSGLAKTLARRTEENLRDGQKEFRDKFISEYLIDFNGYQSYLRAGGKAKTDRARRNEAYNLLHEPYVAKKVQEAIDAAEEKHIISRNRVLAGLSREANYMGLQASHNARVAAYGKLADILKMSGKGSEIAQAIKGGVLIVPQTDDHATWEERAQSAQAALKEAVRT